MGTTKKIGIREAKTHFSKVVSDVQRGTEWIVTERGRAAARIVPIEETSMPLAERLRRLERIGVIEAPAAEARPVPPALPIESGTAQRFLQSDRERRR